MRSRIAALLPAFLLVMGCQPQERPNTAAPAASAPAGIALPSPEPTRRYDAAIKPVDETRTARSVPAPRPAPAPRTNEGERRAIAAWEKEEAAASGSGRLSIAPPPRSPTTTLSLPQGVSATLPRPGGDARTAGTLRTASALATPPSAGERPELPKIEAPPPAPSPPAPELKAKPVAVPLPTVTEAPVERIEPPQTAAASPIEPAPAPPSSPPLTTATFASRSADLSDDARLALGWFARDPGTQRLRQIDLWAWAGGDDPLEARKIAFARALAVHAFLIDQGVKARIEIASFAETRDPTPDRVDVRGR
jgi:hypothetical protein